MSFPHWTLNPPANIRKTNQASERERKKKKGLTLSIVLMSVLTAILYP